MSEEEKIRAKKVRLTVTLPTEESIVKALKERFPGIEVEVEKEAETEAEKPSEELKELET